MARRSAPVIASEHFGDSHWEILAAEALYIITYRGEPCSIRVTSRCLQGQYRKYHKSSYTNLGNVRAQVRALNQRFSTDDFGYQQVGGFDEV